jgi:Cu/Ag efflux protein CusF
MKHRSFAFIATFMLASAGALAADDHSGHTGHQAADRQIVVAQAGSMTEGEVRKIDKAQGKITLKHGAIRNLEMPAMTMVFKVTDAAMLERVKQGDKVGFTADKIGGEYTVTSIEAQK